MSSIYQDQADRETQREIDELLQKKADYGWTEADAERYRYLEDNLNRSRN